jgi:hypothetical protein
MHLLRSVHIIWFGASLCLVSGLLASCVDQPPGDESEGRLESEIVNGSSMVDTSNLSL